MNATVVDWQAWTPTDQALTRQDSRIATDADPARPDGVPDGHWRRMGRLGRAVAACAATVMARHPAIDRAALPIVWGTALGEVDASSLFLDRLAAEGPARVSPLVFQGSVYNAAVARLSLAMGLRGPTETIACGQATALAALARGVEWLARAPAVLVIAGDELPWAAKRAIEVAGAVPGEGSVALLLAAGDAFSVSDGSLAPAPRRPLPYEAERAWVPPDERPLSAALPLVAWLAEGRGRVVADDDGTAITAAWLGA